MLTSVLLDERSGLTTGMQLVHGTMESTRLSFFSIFPYPRLKRLSRSSLIM
jgi:hypothetical protein